MTKISDLTSLTGVAVDPAADLFPIVDMSEAGTTRNKKITPDEVRIALDLDSSASPQFTALNLGHASDTTLTRVSAGVVAIEGVNIVTTAGGVTFAADIVVPDEAYDATAWNGSLEVPTKNAVRDKIESLSVGGGIDVEDEGVSEATGVTILNFVGAGVAATDAGGGQVDVTIAGGGSGVDVEDEGTPETSGATTLNFVGAGVTAADAGGGQVDITIPGGASFSGALVKKSADQTTANYVGGAVVAWDSEGTGCYDTSSIHDNSTNPSRLTTPVGATYVQVWGQIYVTNNTADTFFRMIINKNGSSDYPGVGQVGAEIGSTSAFIQAFTAIVPVTGGTDYFEIFLISESDNSVTIEEERSWFAMRVIA